MDKNILKLISEQSEPDTDKILKALLSSKLNFDVESKSIIDVNERIEKLKLLSDNYKQHCDFKVGDIVKWKEGLKNKKLPRYKEPAIIMEILTEPLLSDLPSATPYFREKLDIILGIITEEEELITFHYDKNRFELYKHEE